ncbi:hypothetical protein K1X84_01370 [bacterium]|nr:hypothetical protein [bacterium]
MSRTEVLKSLIGKKIRIVLKNNHHIDGVLSKVEEHLLTFNNGETLIPDHIENFFVISDDSIGKIR